MHSSSWGARGDLASRLLLPGLGRSTVLNVLGPRFTGRLFEPLWSRERIGSVGVSHDEELGLEHRAGEDGRPGALVDVVRSRLLQVTGMVTMEAPVLIGAAGLRTVEAGGVAAQGVP